MSRLLLLFLAAFCLTAILRSPCQADDPPMRPPSDSARPRSEPKERGSFWRNLRPGQLKQLAPKPEPDWKELKKTLDQIRKLQPRFVPAWRYQGWNLSFEVSSEWDDYRDRYRRVVEGIKYLDEGREFNDRESRMLWDESWMQGYRIGRGDEHRQFRELFRNSDKGARAEEKPGSPTRDNWLWSKAGFREVLNLHETKDVPLLGMGEEFYYSEPAKCHIRFSEALIEEGKIGDKARARWKLGLNEWNEFGERPLEKRDALDYWRHAKELFQGALDRLYSRQSKQDD